jgi:hypothetical protein
MVKRMTGNPSFASGVRAPLRSPRPREPCADSAEASGLRASSAAVVSRA